MGWLAGSDLASATDLFDRQIDGAGRRFVPDRVLRFDLSALAPDQLNASHRGCGRRLWSDGARRHPGHSRRNPRQRLDWDLGDRIDLDHFLFEDDDFGLSPRVTNSLPPVPRCRMDFVAFDPKISSHDGADRSPFKNLALASLCAGGRLVHAGRRARV